MRVVYGCVARLRDIRESLDLASSLDVHRQIAACAKLHDEIDIALCAYDIYELCDMAVGEAFENLNFGLKILKELRSKD